MTSAALKNTLLVLINLSLSRPLPPAANTSFLSPFHIFHAPLLTGVLSTPPPPPSLCWQPSSNAGSLLTWRCVVTLAALGFQCYEWAMGRGQAAF